MHEVEKITKTGKVVAMAGDWFSMMPLGPMLRVMWVLHGKQAQT